MTDIAAQSEQESMSPTPVVSVSQGVPPLSPMPFTATKICYTDEGFFVLIDSIDNAIDLLLYKEDSLQRIGRYVVDQYKGRHDLSAILRPKSVTIVGKNILFLASAQDSALIGVLPIGTDGADGSLPLIDGLGFNSHCDAFNISEKKLIIVGFNPAGYDINILNISQGVEHLSAATVQRYHYHVPKQSERIQASDPYGVGLTVVAVLVVFFALVCIAVVLKFFGKAIEKIQKRKDQSEFSRKLADAVTASDNDIYAAIAAAIYLYEEDMHDEEDTVLTIQKVERAWTPWNAKFYNMNQYFNRKGRS